MERADIRPWAGLLLTVLGAWSLVVLSERLPAPEGLEAPASHFSEARALPTVRLLAEDIGTRVIGTEGQQRAAQALVELLRGIPGVEVQVQEASGADDPQDMGRPRLYRVRNVLARLPGRRPEAVLVSAHYDSPPESVGAGDNALSVAVAVEVLRALASGPTPAHTVILNLNDGEEAGTLGSAAVLGHPWLEPVRAFINLDAAGVQGRAMLFQLNAGSHWLATAYARAAPRPHGTVVAQDVFQSGIIPSYTDFFVYTRRTRWPGLDLAFYEDGYAYHTALDRPERLSPGSLQHLGDNLLASLRALEQLEPPAPSAPAPGVYYDVLGRVLVVYGRGMALALAGLAVALALVLVGWLLAARRVGVLEVLEGQAVGVGALLAGLVLALGAALLLAWVHPHGWFARPAPGVVGFGAVALAGWLAVQAAWSRWRRARGVPPERLALALRAGAVLTWSLLALVAAVYELGSGYLALAWALPGAVALLLVGRRPAWQGLAHVLAYIPGALLTAQVARASLAMFIPLAGRMDSELPLDPLIALLVALPLLMQAHALAPWLERAGRLGLSAAAAGAVGLVALTVNALLFPYTPERPKRLLLAQECEQGGCRMRLEAMDPLGLRPLRGVLQEVSETQPGVYGWQVEAEELPGSTVDIVPLGTTPEGMRRLRLTVSGDRSLRSELRIPRSALAGWSLGVPMPSPKQAPEVVRLQVVAPPRDSDWWVELELRPQEPVPVELRHYSLTSTPVLQRTLSRLPEWTTTHASAYLIHRLEL